MFFKSLTTFSRGCGIALRDGALILFSDEFLVIFVRSCLNEIKAASYMDISFDIDITERNTFGMKVKAGCLVEYYSVAELVEVLGREDLPRPFFHIGGGSNLLFTGDFAGTVLHSRICFIEHDEAAGGNLVRVGAGVLWDDFCAWCSDKNLWGPENLSMIPGEVGAAAVQNIGAYGREVCEIISMVECYDTVGKKMVAFKPSDCEYGYRSSMFKTKAKGRYIVTAVSFSLQSEYSPVLGYGKVLQAVTEACGEYAVGGGGLTPSQVRDVVMKIRDGKLPDPEKVGSAGSFFRNPVVAPEVFGHVCAVAGTEAPHYLLENGMVKIPAAWLIEQCGWKGYSDGNAAVWPAQPLVIVNATGKASPQEIMALEEKIVSSVEDSFGITLEPEVEHVGL